MILPYGFAHEFMRVFCDVKSCWTSGEASSRTFMVNTFFLYRMVSWFKILTTASGRGWVWGGVFASFGCGKGKPAR
jgi:hypothetical protein